MPSCMLALIVEQGYSHVPRRPDPSLLMLKGAGESSVTSHPRQRHT